MSGKREDLRVGLVTNSTLVKIYKEKYGVKWFDQHSYNSIVLEREPGLFSFYDLTKESDDITFWINKISLSKNGDQINRESLQIAKSVNQP